MSLICYSSDENVGNKVFLGSKKDAKDKDKLQKLVSNFLACKRTARYCFIMIVLTMRHFDQGITHILNCTPEKDVFDAKNYFIYPSIISNLGNFELCFIFIL